MRNAQKYFLCSFVLLLLSLKSSEAQKSDEVTISILVGFNSLEEENSFVKLRSSNQMTRGGKPASKIKHEFKRANAIAMEVTKAELETMRRDPSIRYIEDDPIVHLARIPMTNKESILEQKGKRFLYEDSSYGLRKIQGDQAIPQPPSADGKCAINVCIVDSGLLMTHYDIPYNSSNVQGAEFGSLPSGQYWYNPDPLSNEHGTSVAGIMIAEGGNGRGITGVIPNGPEESGVCLLIARVFADGSETTNLSSIIRAAEWCADNDANIVNLSVASPSKTDTEEAIYEKLYDQGVLLIAAAGNSGTEEYAYPASHDSVISVAAVNGMLRRASFSQYNNQVELAAPGYEILTTIMGASGVGYKSGTSFAAPFVTGAAAKIWAANPTCSNKDIRTALTESALPLWGDVPNQSTGYGLVQVFDAYQYIVLNLECTENKYLSIPTSSTTAQPTSLPTTQEPSKEPSLSPSVIPAVLWSDSNTCMGNYEDCSTNSDCCSGFTCRRRSADPSISWVCRSVAKNSKEKLSRSAYCRGGTGGGCHNRQRRLRGESLPSETLQDDKWA